MQEALAQIMSYALGVWRHRWLALATAWVLALAGWAYVWQMPEYYAARARIFVDTNSVLRPLMQGLAITPDINQRIAMLSRTLLNRPNLEKLARMNDLDLKVTTDQQRDQMISQLERSIGLRAERGSTSLYTVSVTDRDPELARRIAQSLITIFVESSLSDKRQDSVGAQSFIEQQILEYEKRLVAAENRLARFKQENVDLLPSKWGGDYYTRLEETRKDLKAAELLLEETQQRRDELQRQLASDSPSLAGLLGSAVSTPLDARIEQLQQERDMLLTRYTELHPQVRQLSGTIKDLQAQREEQLKALSGSVPGVDPESTLYGDLRGMLADAEAAVAELRVRVDEFRRREVDLLSKLQQIPETEARLKQLDRDYEIISDQYASLVQRRESAQISQDVESNADDVTFRVVDPPFVPSKPAEPNKLLLNAAVLVGSIGGGVGVALLLSLLQPIVMDARMLAQATGLPLLGAVSFNKSPRQRRSDRWRLVGFSVCTLSLIIVFGGVLLAPKLIA